MIQLPLFTHLRVEGYGLFPGKPAGSGIDWTFERGLTLIAGINGLGKTTLLTMLLRCLTGPCDLSGDGNPYTLKSILPGKPVPLKAGALRFFSQRVADQAITARVTLRAKIGTSEIAIERRLSDLTLVNFSATQSAQNPLSFSTSAEGEFQEKMCELSDLGSFVDVILILHHVIFFTENRPGALWDANAQRQILRALLLDRNLASRISSLERKVQSADSKARNLSAAAFGVERRLREAQKREDQAPSVVTDLAVEQRLLDAEIGERDRLSGRISDLDDERKDARREYEQAKLGRERAENVVEEMKFAVLARLFPKMEDAARLVILKMLATGDCMVCGAEAHVRRDELERLLADGICPACGAAPESQENIVPPFKVEEARVKRARRLADLTRTEEEASRNRLEEAMRKYDETLSRLSELRKSIQDRTALAQMLSASLPLESEDVARLRDALADGRRAQKEAEAERAVLAKKLKGANEMGQPVIAEHTERLSAEFSGYVKHLLSENACLVRIATKAKLTQGKQLFEVSAFRPEMTSANKSGLARRNTTDDVSESQREQVDLAFRLALISVATGSASCSFIMETPEASLDELAMVRVGNALHQFASTGENRLVVTSNLTNAGMINAVFGGPSAKEGVLRGRNRRVLNLLELAAPNQALLNDGSKYRRILTNALKGQA